MGKRLSYPIPEEVRDNPKNIHDSHEEVRDIPKENRESSKDIHGSHEDIQDNPRKNV